jgi:hypothetical protein
MNIGLIRRPQMQHVDHAEQRIRETAYRLWESDGRPAGQAERHWEMARKMAEEAERAPAPAAARGQSAGAAPAKSRRSAKR